MNFKKTWKRFFTVSRASEGFTLVELIVVIAILAILAGIAVPAYSGYIKKANKAADLQLLGAVNTAFAAAALENGDDVKELSSARLTYGGSEGAVTVTGVAYVAGANTADYDEAFQNYYSGNAGASFKVITQLIFSNGAFHDPASAPSGTVVSGNYNGNTLYFSQSAIDAVNGSAFGTIGADGLMDRVDYVTTLATAMIGENGNSTFAQIVSSQEYGAALAEAMGYDLTTQSSEFLTALNGMVGERMDQLAATGNYGENPSRTEDSDLYKDALNGIYANNAVLYAAQNSASASSNIMSILGSTSAQGTILANLTSEDHSSDGLAQAAMAYGLYTAYAQRNEIDVPSTAAGVLAALDSDTGFKNYINNVDGNGYAAADLEGYMSAMDMINSSASNADAVSDVLVNGFANEELVTLLQTAMGSSTQN